MDEVEEIQINFAAFRCPAPAPGLLVTFLWEFNPKTETRFYVKNGEKHMVGPFQGIKTVDYKGEIGVQEICYIPHPETRTMPKSLGSVISLTLKHEPCPRAWGSKMYLCTDVSRPRP
jgi:saccharopine dehydrogenase-like NADP-dependent oxidoreductase